jgi:hypothetical protein
MAWDVEIVGKAKKKKKNLPDGVRDSFYFLIAELRLKGAVLPHFPHFGKIRGKKGAYHCHLTGGSHPTYVVCWRLTPQNEIEIIEVYYVGTHENAPY